MKKEEVNKQCEKCDGEVIKEELEFQYGFRYVCLECGNTEYEWWR